jgi:LysR family transcriptional regulator, glycine cleavage system transcriptional activator
MAVLMPLRDKLPSPGALFMFEAAARHLNFTLAAREFNVTQPAVSRMISRLEGHIGLPLFLRRPTGLELTEEGRLLHRAVRAGFDRIEEALREIAARGTESEAVTLSVTSAFAIHWLMPRFDRIRRRLPGVTIRLDLIHGEPYGRLGAADIGLRYGMSEGEEVTRWPLVPEAVIPVCSPAYRAAQGPIDGAAGLRGQTLASLVGKMRIPWAVFLDTLGLEGLRDATELSFSDYALVIQAANKGQGVALGWWHVVADELLAGELVPAAGSMLVTETFYNLVARSAALRRPAVRQVCDLLLADFAALEADRQALGLRAVKGSGGRL